MKVSIALCTYNGERYIQEQLDSLLSQTRLPDEIIVSDDGSTDQTVSIVKATLSALNIKHHIYTPLEKLGVFKNFEFCMSQCTGDVIFPCDQDDIWKPTKIERHLSEHLKHPKMNLVYSNADVILKDIDHYLYPLWNPKEIASNRYHRLSNIVYKGRSIAGFCMSIKKDFFNAILPIPNQVYHDDWCATCAAVSNSIIGIPESLAYYRQHGDNVVGIVRGSKLSYLKSLFTNVPFYVKSDEYIAERNQTVLSSLVKVDCLKSYIDPKECQEMIEFYSNRSQYTQKPFGNAYRGLLENLKKGRYRYHHGFFTFLKDVYNLIFMKLKFNLK